MFDKVLIANRGAIACRIQRTLKRMNIASVAVYSDADATSRHVLDADEAFHIGPAPSSASYLSIDAILRAARLSGAQAVHPGYGFLSESIAFARACAEQGIVFIGPAVEHIEAFARKHTARAIAKECNVPLLPGTGILSGLSDALDSAGRIGYPVMLKSTAGGGGIGMRVCDTAQQLRDAYESVSRLSQNSFGDGSVYLEKFISRAKHIEVQIFGDGRGGVIALGARDCSAQRRHQKVLEETPVFGLDLETEKKLELSARTLGCSVSYRSAGTVEFLFDVESKEFYFLEVNTRLQVEHGVTEQVTGLDIVEMMVMEAAGDLASLDSYARTPAGHSIEARIYAEDPARGFLPAPGKLSFVSFPPPELARTETWVESGTEVTPFYDPMIAKVIVTGETRSEAVGKMQSALACCSIEGTETNLLYLRGLVDSIDFADGSITTTFLNDFSVARRAFEVLDGGMQTTVQDYPGRLGYWHVGVPPSGPMDSLAFRLANRIVGNAEGIPALEMTGIGVKIRFDAEMLISICGADMCATLDEKEAPLWETIAVPAGSVLRLSEVRGPGSRAYLAVRGGIRVPMFLGSGSTFMLGGFGGHAGRALRSGDVIHVGESPSDNSRRKLPADLIPAYARHWDVAVLNGPHSAPDFFSNADIETIFSTSWRVHYQTDRTGIRLVGPKPEWARKDGGEAGLHPSNIHDNAYAIGSIDFTGDMPILLGPDGPSLGGFVCPGVVVSSELWKLGQMKAGDTVAFHRISESQAAQLEGALDRAVDCLYGPLPAAPLGVEIEPAVLKRSASRKPEVTYRAGGDKYLLIEYGDAILDLALRFRVHLLEQKLRSLRLEGIVDITPGVRSLQIHYDNRRLPRVALLEAIDAMDAGLPELSNVTVPSRTVHMPLSWDDPATRLAQSKYSTSVRRDAPWCPDNIEFIRRINGLRSASEVFDIVHAASYLVLGLGDVYLGAPVSTPTDPRHRLITTKYNPARTWTPENAVGIGGAYLCIYGMEGPGGYQLVGRTVPVWNTYRSTGTFPSGYPWCLRFFDQIRFHPVSAANLAELRTELLYGRYELKIEEGSFHLRSYLDFLESIAAETAAFRRTQRQAFGEERERWRVEGLLETPVAEEFAEPDATEVPVAEGCISIPSPMAASIFQLAVDAGQRVLAGSKLIVLDAMKTEILITAPVSGVVERILCAPGRLVHAGQALVILRVG